MSPRPERKVPPKRYRLNVPIADSTVNEWLDAQDNVSNSLRAVIREYIERNGFEDPTCRPVTQLPRKGRPPGSSLDQGDGYAEAEAPSQRDQRDQRAPRVDASALAQAIEDGPSSQTTEGPLGRQLSAATGRMAEGDAQEAAAAAAAAAATRPSTSQPRPAAQEQALQPDIARAARSEQGGQQGEHDQHDYDGGEPIDMDDIFSTGRNR